MRQELFFNQLAAKQTPTKIDLIQSNNTLVRTAVTHIPAVGGWTTVSGINVGEQHAPQ